MTNGVSIKQALTLDPELPTLVKYAIDMNANFYGFYFTFTGDNDYEGYWDFWISEFNDATASNCYYTKQELISLLIQFGY